MSCARQFRRRHWLRASKSANQTESCSTSSRNHDIRNTTCGSWFSSDFLAPFSCIYVHYDACTTPWIDWTPSFSPRAFKNRALPCISLTVSNGHGCQCGGTWGAEDQHLLRCCDGLAENGRWRWCWGRWMFGMQWNSFFKAGSKNIFKWNFCEEASWVRLVSGPSPTLKMPIILWYRDILTKSFSSFFKINTC